jgi:hypothetical protein
MHLGQEREIREGVRGQIEDAPGFEKLLRSAEVVAHAIALDGWREGDEHRKDREQQQGHGDNVSRKGP